MINDRTIKLANESPIIDDKCETIKFKQKKNSLKISNVTGVVLMALLVLASCAKDESPIIVDEATFDVAELTSSDEAELISEEIANIGEDVYATEETKAISKVDFTSNYLPDCVTVTTVVTSTTK